MNNARLSNPSNVGGASGVENVKNMWLHHYQSLLNSIPGSPANIKSTLPATWTWCSDLNLV